MVALLARRRLGTPDAKSVDQLAQVEQITEPAEIVDSVIGIDWRHASKRLYLPIGPARRNQRPTAIRQDCEEIADAASPDGTDDGQRPTFESVTLARDRYRSRNIMVMGSLWPPPSTISTTSFCCGPSGNM